MNGRVQLYNKINIQASGCALITWQMAKNGMIFSITLWFEVHLGFRNTFHCVTGFPLA